MNIQEITTFRPEYKDVINRFLVQLAGEEYLITDQQIESIISDPNSHLFFAANDDGKYMGMISIGLYITPTGRKAWIEDVVVDDSCRGEGVGKSLTYLPFNMQKIKRQMLLCSLQNLPE